MVTLPDAAVVLRSMGERAVLAEVADLAAVVRLHAALAADPPGGIDDLVPAARTVLVCFDPARIAAASVRSWIRSAAERPTDDPEPGLLVEVPLRYDGVDLDDTAALLGIPAADLVSRHAAAEWSVAFTGFAPGFAYLVSAHWPFDVPRLDQPRTRVPAGAVGLAAGFTGAYPRETPGGWRLIASTDAVLFDPDATHPVLLPPRARVRFVPERSRVEVPRDPDAPAAPRSATRDAVDSPPAPAPATLARDGGRPALRILDPGAATTVQDLGRPHRAALGVARSGALDRVALRTANRLVGNDEGAAGLEILLGGWHARAETDTWVCVTGALLEVRVDEVPVDLYAPLLVPAGSELSIGVARLGLRSYLAVRGGVEGAAVMHSRARDSLAGLGPAPLRTGDLVRAGVPASAIPSVDVFPWTVPPSTIDVALAEGPRADWFAPRALATLFAEPWTVSADLDRVGIRLDGPVLERIRPGELPSEGMTPGALQVPPHGRPVVLLADGPVTGGYPVIAVATEAGTSALAQARPGDTVRFRRA
ncbi:urea amidolyase family protein [Microbacterium testaceum]|uniref:5-oxoprolinase subunit B/C family protein n=1 Tax=Microbacterium testaceum TaxID=2033 RepID=UPI0021565682|nr:urea amidolyase family protein [Microbacterium testaceum]